MKRSLRFVDLHLIAEEMKVEKVLNGIQNRSKKSETSTLNWRRRSNNEMILPPKRTTTSWAPQPATSALSDFLLGLENSHVAFDCSPFVAWPSSVIDDGDVDVDGVLSSVHDTKEFSMTKTKGTKKFTPCVSLEDEHDELDRQNFSSLTQQISRIPISD